MILIFVWVFVKYFCNKKKLVLAKWLTSIWLCLNLQNSTDCYNVLVHFLGCEFITERWYANGDTVTYKPKKPLVWDTESCITECLKEKSKNGRIGAVFTGAKKDDNFHKYQNRNYYCHCANGAEKTERPARNKDILEIKGCPIKGIT